MTDDSTLQSDSQYSLIKILVIWAAAALPMGLLSWVVVPAIAPDFGTNPLGSAVTRVLWMTLGLVWLFVLTMIIVYAEEGNIRWATITKRLRLNKPKHPNTGEPQARLWLWLIPFVILVALVQIALGRVLVDAWLSIFPFFEAPPGFDAGKALGSPEIQAQLENAWWFLGLFVVFGVFNTFLGEELLFRGVLLPKMNGVFGKWDWVANGIFFGFYHLSQPWGILGSCVTGFLYAYPTRRYRSTWFSVILHSAQSVFIIFLILGIVLGLA